MLRYFTLLVFGTLIINVQSQSIYDDILLVQNKMESEDCFDDAAFKRLKNNYGLHYITMDEVGVKWCGEEAVAEGFNYLTEVLRELNYGPFDTEEQGKNRAGTDSYISAANQLDSFKKRISFLDESEKAYIASEEAVNEFETWEEKMINFMDRYGDSIRRSRGAGFLGPLMGMGNNASVGGTSSAGTSLFSASPAVFVNAASNFIVAKTKYELNAKFVDELRKVYKERVEFKELMPAANEIIMGADPLNFSTWNTMLQGALKKDIFNMPYNLPKFINSEHSFFKDIDPESLETVSIPLMALQAFENNKRGMMPVSNFLRLEEDFGIKERPNFKLSKGMSLTRTLVESFSSQGSLVPTSQIYEVANDRQKKEIFYFLYTNKYNDLLNKIATSDSSTVALHLSEDWEKSTNELLTLSARLNGSLIQANNSFSKIQDGTLDKANARNEMVAINSIIPEFIDAAYTYLFIVEPDNEKTKGRYNRLYKPLSVDAVNLANGVLLENYNAALLATVNIMVTSLREVNHSTKSESDEDVERIVKNRERIDKMIHWGGFLADFLALDNETDATDLFVKYSTVNASYRVKRSSKYSLSVNTYPGLFFGNEQTNFTDNFRTYNSSTALSVPVGFSLSQAFTRTADSDEFDYYKEKKDRLKLFSYTGFVHGVFFSIFDMGAPFAYKWTSDESSGFTDELKWSQLFAPGAYYTFGLKGSGLTLALGGQMTPELRAIEQSQLETQESAWRFGMMLTYDIPVLTLWKSKH